MHDDLEMRTTNDIDAGLLQAAKELAESRRTLVNGPRDET
jgi:hypothetical protein